MSDTPKTDELAKRDFVPDGLWIRHARELERENAALRQKLELSSNNQTDEYICVDREHGLWKRKNKTL